MIVDWWIENIEPKVLARPKIILGGISITFIGTDVNILAGLKIILRGTDVTFIGTGVNNCYFQLSMKLIFGLIDNISYWGIKELNLDWKKIHLFNVRYIFLYL